MRAERFRLGFLTCLFSFSFIVASGCSTTVYRTNAAPSDLSTEKGAAGHRGATIEIKPNSPADTVRAFYAALRERKFRQAIFLTNLRPAVEGLTDAELAEFSLDFEAIAKYVPKEIEINGEIISGALATVTAKLPTEDLDKEEIQEIRLRKEGDVWVILTVDEAAEQKIKQEGKNYFPNLKIETHQDEAKAMLDRVAKAQMAYAAQNQGRFGDMDQLIAAEVLPADIRSSESTGYRYTVTVTSDKKRYSALAVPAVYGKTGRMNYAIELDGLGQPHLVKHDPGSKPK